MNVAKIHRKLMITESQFYFTNISATKARIFMKFHVVVNHYLLILSLKLNEDPCTNELAQVVNPRTRDKTCECTFTTRVRSIVHQSS